MAMTEPAGSDRSGLAAEYVLGTLDAAERAEAEALMLAGGAFAAEVEAWRRRLDPLLEAPPATPPAGVQDEVLAAIGPENGARAEILQLRRRAAAWKWVATGAAAIAASLAVFIASRSPEPPRTPAYVAVLESPDKKPAFVATADPAHGGLSIRRVGLPPPPNRSFELWAIPEGAAPQSLGVVDRSAAISAKTLIQKTGGEPLAKIVLAITEEPEGGSPDGKPSGAPLFTGKLVQAPES